MRYFYFVSCYVSSLLKQSPFYCNTEIVRGKEIKSIKDIREIETEIGEIYARGGISASCTILNYQLLRTENDEQEE